MNPEVVLALVEVGRTLSEIQIEGVRDETGFSNADKTIGLILSSVVAADPSNEDRVRSLARLVTGYRRQSEGLVGAEMHARFKELAQDQPLTMKERDLARNVVIAKPDIHEKWGARLLLSWESYKPSYSDALRRLGMKPFKDGKDWKWAARPELIDRALEALQVEGAEIVGSTTLPSYEADGAEAVAPPDPNLITVERYSDKSLGINWAYGRHADWNDIARNLPRRTWNKEKLRWVIPLKDVAIAESFYREAGADVSQFTPFLALAPSIEELTPEEPDYFERVRPELFDSFMPFQVDGVKFLTKPLKQIRAELRASDAKGQILGDDMGMGKTIQTIAAANAIAEADDTILVVCPATLKLNWKKEIRKWGFGEDVEDVHVLKPLDCTECGHGGSAHKSGKCENFWEIDPATNKKIRPIAKTQRWMLDKKGEKVLDDHGVARKETIPHVKCDCTEPMKGGFDKLSRWNIVNYDILDLFYNQLLEEGFDILICDEAHYAKNRESMRSKLVVGAPAKKKAKIPSPAIKGLCEAATKRVFLLTGTPMVNRPKDIFQLLKGAKHPLSRNWKAFGDRYCAPEFNGWGTTYNGGTNLDDLRQRIAPIFLQRKKEDYLDLPDKIRDFMPVEVDLTEYHKKMDEYEARKRAGELSRTEHHLALINEARVCCATAKIPVAIELIGNSVENGDKVIVFTNRTNVLHKIVKHFGDQAVFIDGSVSETGRQLAEKRFMEDDSVRMIVGNLQAMGTGLNLTAANRVYMVDLDWVPNNHRQAEDRAYRIGQHRMVNVTYLLAAGTFDEDMGDLLNEKLDQINDFEGQDGSMFPDLMERLSKGPRNEGIQAIEKAKALPRRRTAA